MKKNVRPETIPVEPPAKHLKLAVLEILGRLPAPKNIRMPHSSVLALALDKVPALLREGAKPVLRRLVACSPSSYGQGRSPVWWAIVLRILSTEDALEAYLGQFPVELTDTQRAQLVQEIILRFELEQADAHDKCKRFVSRELKISPVEQCDGYARSFVSADLNSV